MHHALWFTLGYLVNLRKVLSEKVFRLTHRRSHMGSKL